MSHFNQMATQWDTPEKIQKTQKLADAIKKELEEFKYSSVLDVGCGTGLLGLEFMNPETSLLGIDTSSGMLEVFDEKTREYPLVESLLWNLEEAPLEREFDLIVSAMAFHHLNHPQVVLERLKSMLRPSGIIAIVDLDQEDGSFHPNPENMGVKHFGFAKETLLEWAQKLDLTLKHSIINTIEKNEQTYGQFLALYGRGKSLIGE